jgi:periplasmic divalent cation tolerance protein
MASSARIVLTTAPDVATARGLARALVEERLAACCNLLEGATSVYRWQGALAEEREVLLVIKTCAERLAELERALLARHPYAVPELVALAPEHVEPRYAAWLSEACGAGAPAGERA